MSTDNNIWMGDIQPWMDESFILNSFKYYNIHPLNVKLIHDRTTNELKNFCFITFENVEEANNCITKLNGKPIPNAHNSSIKFKLNWANYFSTFNKSVYVGNLSPDVDDISLYKLFKEKYSSVHHASVITDKGKSKGFGFILFRGEKDYERCLKEMNGITFHGNVIRGKEQRKKEDDIKSNNFNENNEKYNFNKNNNYQNKNIYQNSLNNNIYNDINMVKHSIGNNLNIFNNINNYNLEQNKLINQNQYSPNIINNIININNINRINNINNINDIYNKNQLNNNFVFNNGLNNNSFNDINMNSNISNHPSLLYKYQNENNDIVSLIPGNENLKINNIKNNQLNKTFKNNNQAKYKFEILNKYDNETLNQKIKENLEKMYKYYTDIYPGDKNKLRCKLYYIIILIFKIVSNMFTYHCHSEKQLKLFSSHNIKNTFIV